MRQFDRNCTSLEVVQRAAEHGFTVDAGRHQDGGDHIVVSMPGPTGALIPVMYNTVSGRFFYVARDGSGHFASDRDEHDGEPWFDAMLDFFYVEKKEIP